MPHPSAPTARVSIIIRASPAQIFSAFIDPKKLTGFWLSSSAAPLAVGNTVQWKFKVPGAEVFTTATKLVPDTEIAWEWSDGTSVDIALQALEGLTAVSLINRGFKGNDEEVVAAALNATEGFALVLADLKTMLESGISANIVTDKALLIELRQRMKTNPGAEASPASRSHKRGLG